MCKSWCDFILAVIILVFSFVTWAYSKWIIVIAAILLLIHSFGCKKCFVGMGMAAKGQMAKRKR